MDDFIKELSEIPWINVVESVRAFETYRLGSKKNGKVWTIIHRTFALATPRSITAKSLETLRWPIIRDLISDTVWGETKPYPWEKGEGAMVREFSDLEIGGFLFYAGLSYSSWVKTLCRLPEDHALWLCIRLPWEIEQNNEKSIMYGRFGCGIFHKDAKRVEGLI